MKDYFLLQQQLLNRKIKEAGTHPIIGLLLSLGALVLISEFIFNNTVFAPYLILLFCIGILFKLSEKSRSEFLLSIFGNPKKRTIRIIENGLVSLPFLLILFFKNAFLESALLLIISLIGATLNLQTNFNFSIPTPFSKKPFEFMVGFRKSLFFLPIPFILTLIAMSVDNLNLGLFSMILTFLISASYYTQPENEYYVWIYTANAKSFLMKKMKAAILNVFILNLPILMGLLIFFPNDFVLITLIYLFGTLFLLTVLLAKYSAFPEEIGLLEGLYLAVSIAMPPLFLVMLVLFYNRAIRKLNVLLND